MTETAEWLLRGRPAHVTYIMLIKSWDMCTHDHLLHLNLTTADFGGLFPTMYYKYHTTTLHFWTARPLM